MVAALHVVGVIGRYQASVCVQVCRLCFRFLNRMLSASYTYNLRLSVDPLSTSPILTQDYRLFLSPFDGSASVMSEESGHKQVEQPQETKRETISRRES